MWEGNSYTRITSWIGFDYGQISIETATHSYEIDGTDDLLLQGTVYCKKECVAVLIGLYKNNGVVLCVGLHILSDCSIYTAMLCND